MGKTENEETEFAKKFREWMVAAGYSDATAVSRKAGLEPSTLSRVLKGERGMEAASARKVANVLGVSQIELFEAAGLIDRDAVKRWQTILLSHLKLKDAFNAGSPEIVVNLMNWEGLFDDLQEAKLATISRIVNNLDNLNESDLVRVEAMIRAYVSASDSVTINTKQPPITGDVGVGGELTAKLIKGKGKPA